LAAVDGSQKEQNGGVSAIQSLLYNPVFLRPAAGRSFARLTISASFAIFAVKIVFAFLKWHPRFFRRRCLAGKVFRFKF
jgi:hypothetical protein